MLSIVFLSFMHRNPWPDVSGQMIILSRNKMSQSLLGGLLLLLLLLLGISLILLCGRCLLNNRCGLFSLGFFLDGNEKTNDILGLDHVVFINLKFTEDIINFSLGHLVSLLCGRC